MAGLYVHVPFCARKCLYCDFTSYAGRLADAGRYLGRLEREMEDDRARFGEARFETVYFGGGTPSLPPHEIITSILERARALFSFAPDAEISLEANPGTVDRYKLDAYRRAGFNRLSIGAQAAQNRLLRSLGRIHAREDAESAVSAARAAGFDNLSLDLMYGLPGQTSADFRESLAWAISLAPEHISCYSLIVEPGTPFAEANVREADEDALADMQDAAVSELGAAGYGRYEISNFARPGFECRHNLDCWRGRDYLGVGCAAHSLMNGRRFANSRGLLDYERGEERVLSEEERFEERVMLGLRTREGVDTAGISQRKIDFLINRKLARINGGRLALTDRGMDVHNAIVLELVTP